MERGIAARKRQASTQAETALRFRTSRPVTEMILYRTGDTFPVCPQCRCALEREYQSFCDRCGQRLGWERYHRALVITRF